MLEETIVDQRYSEYRCLLQALESANEISLLIVADDTCKKSLLLSAASHFENQITNCVLEFVKDVVSPNEVAFALLRNMAVKKEYFKWFNWDADQANQFYGMFGEDFLAYMKRMVRDDLQYDESVKCFIELGRDRNRLVHQDYGTFTLEKTSEEIYDTYIKASAFVVKFFGALRDFARLSGI